MYNNCNTALKPTRVQDTRKVKTRARLTASVIALTLESGCMDLEIAQVAKRAGVNRSTFYAHASSPSVLLEAALNEELRDLYDEHLSQARSRDAGEAHCLLAVATLQYVDAHAELYRLMLTDEACGARLRSQLAGVLTESIAQLDWRTTAVDNSADAQASALFRTAAPAFIAAGVVATVCKWLGSPRRDMDSCLAALRLLLPVWWPLQASPVRRVQLVTHGSQKGDESSSESTGERLFRR